MRIEKIQKIVEKYDNVSGSGRMERWEVVADDGEFTIHARLPAAIEIEQAGVPIKLLPHPA